MKEEDKKLIITRLDTLWSSINDPMLQTLIVIIRDIVTEGDEDKPEMGFKNDVQS